MCHFISVSALDVFLAQDVGFKWRLYLERPLLCVEHEKKEMQTFPSTF